MLTATAASPSPINGVLSTRDLSKHFGVSPYCCRAVADRLGVGWRIGRNRAVLASDLDRIKTGLLAAGFLKPPRARPSAPRTAGGAVA